ncbi:hypothetical protein J1N35_017047 [Gossypium stocksii]|uniref:Uncharacterized protein n=1 Tax=Gossypium stocksii TaxID=47602 RepID=A0A9D3VMT9_9ROSI|nr:hypothetical protein J1N35_017047 [Gossypium stocksii]
MASKMMLLLPYGELWLESCAHEKKLKQQGNFSHRFQEAQLLGHGRKGTHEPGHNEVDILFPFARILFPMFISELVKADQLILAGFLVTKFMHSNASLGFINVVEGSL